MTGRKLTFKTYLKREIMELTNSSDFRLSTFCRNMNWTSFPYVLVYAEYYCGGKDRMLKYVSDAYTERINNTVLPENPEDLSFMKDKEYLEFAKVREGYEVSIKNNSAASPLKMSFQSSFKKALKDLQVPVCQLCSQAGVSQGNFTCFVNGEYDKLSEEKCTSINNMLIKYGVIDNKTDNKRPSMLIPVYVDGEIVENITLKEYRKRNIK